MNAHKNKNEAIVKGLKVTISSKEDQIIELKNEIEKILKKLYKKK